VSRTESAGALADAGKLLSDPGTWKPCLGSPRSRRFHIIEQALSRCRQNRSLTNKERLLRSCASLRRTSLRIDASVARRHTVPSQASRVSCQHQFRGVDSLDGTCPDAAREGLAATGRSDHLATLCAADEEPRGADPGPLSREHLDWRIRGGVGRPRRQDEQAVASWRASIILGLDPRMEAAFCNDMLQRASAQHGKPEVFNTDQRLQSTSAAFTDMLVDNGIAISMNGKGPWRDNVLLERLWCSVKDAEIYLRAYYSVSDARASLRRYLELRDRRRERSSLDGTTPDRADLDPQPIHPAASAGGRSTHRCGKSVQRTEATSERHRFYGVFIKPVRHFY
jgi:transposase InsO family protein